MIRLHQTFGAHTGRVVELDRDVIRFGRLPDNEVAFDPHADLDASGRHAEIRREGAQWVLVDVGSRNGTLVGGRRVTRCVLSSGDEVEFGIGGPRMRVEIGAPAARQGAMTAEATPVHMARPPGGVETAAATPMALQKDDDPAPPSHLPIGAMDAGGALPPMSPVPHPTPPPSPFASAPGTDPGPRAPAQPSEGASPSPPMYGAPPSPAHPPSAGGEKRYGQRTVGMMIQAALQQAEQQRAQGGNRSTAFIRAVASEAAGQSSRGLKIAIAVIAFLLFLTLGAVIAVFFYARYQEQELRDENVRLQRELAELGQGESTERERLEERIHELNQELSEQQETTGASIAERNEGAVFALLRTRSSGRREVLCSAFAVRPSLLATNAHCVGALERAMRGDGEVRAVPHRGSGPGLTIQRMWRHPQFDAHQPVSPDVGLLRVDGDTPQQVQIATMPQIMQLGAGADVFVLGFPAAIADDGAPVAGMTSGVIGRVTAFDGTHSDAGANPLVSHSAFTDDGTAGSPLFDRNGRVVAINAGNFRTRRRVVDANTRVARTVDTETPYAWAVRADLLLQLLAGLPSP